MDAAGRSQGQSQCSQCSHSPVSENAAVGKATSWSAPRGDAGSIVSTHSSRQTSGELASLVVSETAQALHSGAAAVDTTAVDAAGRDAATENAVVGDAAAMDAAAENAAAMNAATKDVAAMDAAAISASVENAAENAAPLAGAAENAAAGAAVSAAPPASAAENAEAGDAATNTASTAECDMWQAMSFDVIQEKRRVRRGEAENAAFLAVIDAAIDAAEISEDDSDEDTQQDATDNAGSQDPALAAAAPTGAAQGAAGPTGATQHNTEYDEETPYKWVDIMRSMMDDDDKQEFCDEVKARAEEVCDALAEFSDECDWCGCVEEKLFKIIDDGDVLCRLCAEQKLDYISSKVEPRIEWGSI